MPWLTAFVEGLGLGVRVFRSDKDSLGAGETRCFASDACSPTKVAHGVGAQMADQVDVILFPKILYQEGANGRTGRTCPVEQGMPDMIHHSLAAQGSDTQVVRPPLSFRGGPRDKVHLSQLVRMARELGVPVSRVPAAAKAAARAQRAVDQALLEIGERTLAYGREHGVPVIVVCGPLHVIHDAAMDAGIPRIIRDNGALALPMDCLEVGSDSAAMKRVTWADSRRAVKAVVAARARGGVFPLLLTSFGCGPASFTEPLMSAVAQGYPHTILETDGHGGTAGFVTRIQAFLHAVRSHSGDAQPVPAERLPLLERKPYTPLASEGDAQLVVYSMSDGFAPLMAAYYRSLGYDAVVAGPNTDKSFATGRRDCSGKECLPYQLLWGAFREHLEADKSGRRKVLMQVTDAGECKNCMFTAKDELNLERMGLADRVGVRMAGAEPEHALAFMTRLFAGFVAWDLLYTLTSWHRPTDPQRVDEFYARSRDAMIAHMERPEAPGARGLWDRTRWWGELERLVDSMAADFAAVGTDMERPGPTVLVTGDIYLRVDEYASGDVVRKLNDRGVRVLVEPSSAFLEYLAMPLKPGIEGLPLPRLQQAHARTIIATVRRRLYARVRKLHPTLPGASVTAQQRASEQVLDRFPRGEAPMTVGSVLHHWQSGTCDGALVVAAWGCGPSLIAESLLRHQRDIPLLFLYSDGTPIDTRRLDAFVFRLLRERAEADDTGCGPLTLVWEPRAPAARRPALVS